MYACEHEIVEWQQRDQEMHAVGWACRWCSNVHAVDYHHESVCRWDFCGSERIAREAAPLPESARGPLRQRIAEQLASAAAQIRDAQHVLRSAQPRDQLVATIAAAQMGVGRAAEATTFLPSDGDPIRLSPEQFSIELEQIVYQALSKRSG